ncbi:conserved membrane hypothetical protein [uncultured Paludibacter sp.]|uniref:CBS domain-containing protein n=1 Tax=uncultured Paludibacter sp. TaxID=497635 RepID=A0A653AJL2_9BACT|nr:conserved membrane hypothetical protein [uncultured Paludibacter sp.]
MQLQKQSQNIASTILDIFYTNEKQFVSTMLVGSYISLAAYGLLFSTLFYDWTESLGSIYVSIFLQVLIATVIILITSRFLPKALFKINSNLWLRLFSPVLLLFYIVLYPIAWIGSSLSLSILKTLKVDIPETTEENIFSKINIDYLLQDSAENKESLKEIEKDVKIFKNALDFSAVKLRDCLIPRTEIVSLEHNAPVNTLKQTFIETGLSKIVIYKADIDNIVGYIHASEMFEHQKDWVKYIKQIPIVPENMAAQKLMKIFMQQKKSIAVVVDEFGGTAGIVTLEDIMEQIFGDIEDEHDVKEYKAEKVGENEYLFEGRLEVEEANRIFDLSIPVSDEYTTIAGYVLHAHQHFPKLNEVIRIDKYTFKCVKVTNNRIELVKMQVNS